MGGLVRPSTGEAAGGGAGGGTAAGTSFDPSNLPTTIVAGVELQTAIEELDVALAGGLAGVGTRTIATITVAASPYAAAAGSIVLANANGGPITVDLPAAASATGQSVVVNKTDSSSNAVTLDGDGAETINGSATETILQQFASVEVTSDGSNWHITG